MNKRNTVWRKFCYELENVENYEKAINSDGGWTLHHRLETHFSDGTPRPIRCTISSSELKALNMYYNRPAEELIFLTRSEHMKLHSTMNNNFKPMFGNKNVKGMHHSNETKRKMSEVAKNVTHTDKWNKKVSEGLKDYFSSLNLDDRKERTKKASTISAKKIKGTKWYNNGFINKRLIEGEQPKGWVLGRCNFRRQK